MRFISFFANFEMIFAYFERKRAVRYGSDCPKNYISSFSFRRNTHHAACCG